MATALITGAAKRLGKEMALFLAKQGWNIAIHYNNSKYDAEKVMLSCKDFGVDSDIFKSDLLEYKNSAELIDSVSKRFPDLSILINSASVFLRNPLLNTDYEQFEQNFNINFTSPYFLSKEFAKKVSSGNIINILDTKIAFSHHVYSSYSLSKKVFGEFTRMAALELAPHIRVNGIAPGVILPPEGKDEEYLNRLINNVPLKKRGYPINILKTLDFLLDNDFITGQIIFVDGGENIK
ncbi:MAG: SDR family oxidoreductase [Candidatus Delongbacteria bacterium]|nr:SDR family oxidoreductase [Candidatus Delongbacteria bacterium]MBN2836056.1 SDR family oxidoreductase [Candidatus Delongbacteria bacterium]